MNAQFVPLNDFECTASAHTGLLQASLCISMKVVVIICSKVLLLNDGLNHAVIFVPESWQRI
jgi:hypothetical protein